MSGVISKIHNENCLDTMKPMEDNKKTEGIVVKDQLTLGSLFAGIGGFELAATWAGIEPVWSNEIDPFACKVLNKNFDHEIIQKDIREIGKHNLPTVDIISGGFPCQPFSAAGKRKGKEDDRYLWPEMLRVISELKPKFVIGENVTGLLSMGNGKIFEGILYDLENEGYNNEVFIIPACSVGAVHKRDRIWIIAYANCKRLPNRNRINGKQKISDIKKRIQDDREINGLCGNGITPYTKGQQNNWNGSERFYAKPSGDIPGWEEFPTQPPLRRRNDGVPNRMDRIKGLGNAIVPQVAFEIFKAINQKIDVE